MMRIRSPRRRLSGGGSLHQAVALTGPQVGNNRIADRGGLIAGHRRLHNSDRVLDRVPAIPDVHEDVGRK